MPLPPLKTLPVFISICRHLSISQAADELCLTHSAVSQSLKSLEAFLGCKLLDRNTRGMRLTEPGRRFLVAVEEALGGISQATHQIMKTQEGEVRLNVAPTLALRWLIPRLPALQRDLPDVALRLSTYRNDELVGRSGGLDMALVSGEPSALEIYETYPLCPERLILVAARDTQPLPLEHLLSHLPRICVNDPLRERDWSIWLGVSGLEASEHSLMFKSSPLAIQATIAGLGLLVTHHLFVVEELEAGLLVQLGDAVVAGAHHLVVHTPGGLSKPARQVLEWLQQEVKECERGWQEDDGV
ncbi:MULTISPECIES: LysR family transcriptional regulator [Aeromonas]|uniref:LysR family transcriptional regulator n=1 Tax=Aeromonas TaxID=642 RepID=UPI0012F33590|nr:LysR substrate-binding domain-containing protein [Aeromonas salmonicida]VXA77214.1 putative Glycine cleavage operon activator [Aeromonas salmonicida]